MLPPSIGILDEQKPGDLFNTSKLAISLRARDRGFDTVCVCHQELLDPRLIQGLIFTACPNSGTEQLISKLRDLGIPTVTLNSYFPNASSVSIDNLTGYLQTAAHLKKLGHRKIAYLTAREAGSPPNEQLQCFRSALVQNDLEFDPELIIEGNTPFSEPSRNTLRLLKEHPDVSAIVCANDYTALGAINAARTLGLEIPQDLAVVGFGNNPNIQNSSLIPFSSVNFPAYNAALRATELLFAEIDQPTSRPVRINVPTNLVIRQSTADQIDTLEPQILSTFRDDPISRLLLLSGDTLSNSDIRTLYEASVRRENSEKSPFQSFQEFCETTCQIGLPDLLVHNLLIDVGNKLSVWQRSQAAIPTKEALIQQLLEKTAAPIGVFKNYAFDLEIRFDRLTEENQANLSADESIESILHWLKAIQERTQANFISIAILDDPTKDLSSFTGNITIWRCQNGEKPSPIRSIIENGLIPTATMYPRVDTPAFVEIAPIESNDQTLALLAVDQDCPFASNFEKLRPILAYRIQQCRLIQSLETQKSELVREKRELEQKRKSADTANSAKSEFLTVMSHEIRTPLNCILGMADVALDSDINENQKEYLDLIKESGQTLLEIINEILDFSKIESGKLALKSSLFSFSDTLDSTVALMTSRANERGLYLKCKSCPTIPDTIIGDPTRVRQILVNLIGNAIKFTDTGGIDLYISEKSRDNDSIKIQIEVCDTGIGIANDQQKKIFEAFEQVDNSSNHSQHGTGLGLTIASRLANQMRGDIGIASVADQGSVFTATLVFDLRDRDETTQQTGTEPSNHSNQSKDEDASEKAMNILVVDDNPSNITVAKSMLTLGNHKVVTALSGRQAIEIFKEKEFDLVLMDIQMPDMDGWKATDLMRAIELEKQKLPATPIYALTSHALAGYEEKCYDAGMDGYISKPIQCSSFLKAIKAASPRSTRYDSDR